MTEINIAYAVKFKNDFILRVQQAGSRLMESVRNEPDFLEGKYGYFDRMAPISTANTKTARHAETPINGTNYDRRRLLRDTRFWGDMVDRSDIERMMKDPTSRIVENARMLFNRTADDYVIGAATGLAWTIDQNDDATAVPLPASQIFAPNGVGLNLVKVLAAMELLDHNEVDDEEERYFVTSAHQITQMLNTTNTTNEYYLQIQALKEGKIDFFAKFRWLRSERLLQDAANSNARMNLAYAKRGIGVAIQGEPVTRVSERGDRGFNTQVYLEWDIGATRVEDECVIQVDCVEP